MNNRGWPHEIGTGFVGLILSVNESLEIPPYRVELVVGAYEPLCRFLPADCSLRLYMQTIYEEMSSWNNVRPDWEMTLNLDATEVAVLFRAIAQIEVAPL